MEWTEITLTVGRADADAAQDAAASFADGGLYIEDYADLEQQVRQIAHVDLIEQELLEKPRDVVLIHLYISPDENADTVAERLAARLEALGISHALTRAGVKQEDWETSWKQYYKPIEIGKRLAIAPSWENYQSSRTTLRMDPGMAFGTGTHETTSLCLEVLDEKISGGEAVLDIGTGSGILSVAALLLGAESALGVDIDPMAVRVAGENAQRNGVQSRFKIEIGDLAQAAAGRQYNIITANIVADAILRLAPDVPPLLYPGGLFVASGIIDDRAAEVEGGLKKAGLKHLETRHKKGWVAILCTI